MKSGRRPRRKLKRAFSFFMTFGLILNVLFGSGFPLLEDKSAGLVVRAAEEEVDNETLPTYTPTTTSFTPGTVYLPSIQSIVDYCYLYKSDTSFASAHQNDDVIMSLTNGMNLMEIDISYQYIVKGLIFVIAVAFDVRNRKK